MRGPSLRASMSVGAFVAVWLVSAWFSYPIHLAGFRHEFPLSYEAKGCQATSRQAAVLSIASGPAGLVLARLNFGKGYQWGCK